MAWLRNNRSASGLLLAVYLLTTTASHLFHVHAHADEHAHAGHGHAHHLAAAEHERAGTGESDAGGSDACHHHDVALTDCDAPAPSGFSAPATADDDACLACRFLGLASLAVELPALPPSHELVAVVRIVEPRHESRSLQYLLHSRAPPSLV